MIKRETKITGMGLVSVPPIGHQIYDRWPARLGSLIGAKINSQLSRKTAVGCCWSAKNVVAWKMGQLQLEVGNRNLGNRTCFVGLEKSEMANKSMRVTTNRHLCTHRTSKQTGFRLVSRRKTFSCAREMSFCRDSHRSKSGYKKLQQPVTEKKWAISYHS